MSLHADFWTPPLPTRFLTAYKSLGHERGLAVDDGSQGTCLCGKRTIIAVQAPSPCPWSFFRCSLSRAPSCIACTILMWQRLRLPCAASAVQCLVPQEMYACMRPLQLQHSCCGQVLRTCCRFTLIVEVAYLVAATNLLVRSCLKLIPLANSRPQKKSVHPLCFPHKPKRI